MLTDTFAALAFIASCVYGYEFFRKGRILHYDNTVKFIVALALFPVFWLAFVGAKHVIIAYNPYIYYLGNVVFGLVALLAMYVGLRYLPVPMNEVKTQSLIRV
jgi:hypothetical protein